METDIASLLAALKDISDMSVEVQLKTLQTILPLLTNYESIRSEHMITALLLCFQLQESKSNVVTNTAGATLLQIVTIVFDRENPSSDSSNSAITSGKEQWLVRDLISIIRGEPASMLVVQNPSRTFCMELLEAILLNHYEVFRKEAQLQDILKQKGCPFFIRCLGEKLDFPTALRHLRLMYLITLHLLEFMVP